MLVVIKKYEFFTRKTNFIRFIIKLGKINSVLGEHLDKFVMVYLNDIIIYLISKEEYGEYIK